MEQNNKTKIISKFELLIKAECSELANFLIKKNKAYGDSINKPVHIFNTEVKDLFVLLNIRLDDKLSRLKRGKKYKNEDTELDIIGYLIIKRVLKRITPERNKDEGL